jgi:hypothetical protein
VSATLEKTIYGGQGQGSQIGIFLIADVLLFDEKIRQSTAQAVFHRLGDPIPSSKHEMYSSRIFWRPVGKRKWVA